MRKSISVVIPVLNEAQNVASCIISAARSESAEIIVVDGGSSDQSKEIAGQLRARVLSSGKGRAGQMNRGAAAARGEILLFLHADTTLPSGYDIEVRRILKDKATAAGAFRIRIDEPRFPYRVLEKMVNFRSKWLKMPYGDQGIFMRKEMFFKAGGFPSLPIMEDFELMRRIGRRGAVALACLPVRTSARRWQKRGLIKTTLLNQYIILAYLAGAAPETLARLYNGKKERIN